MTNLTDMWKAVEGKASQSPSYWRVLPDTKKFLKTLEKELNTGKSGIDIIKAYRGGKTPGTWGHWQVASAYAKYLSAELC